jgi:hypothetical protein
MDFDAVSGLVLGGLKVSRGRVTGISADGEIQVESAVDGSRLACDILKTSAGPSVELDAGDEVLYAVDEESGRGCVLGVIGRYEAVSERLSLAAEEKIELRCGDSVLAMDRDGKVLIRGKKVTSHASETQRIKGGTVKIN